MLFLGHFPTECHPETPFRGRPRPGAARAPCPVTAPSPGAVPLGTPRPTPQVPERKRRRQQSRAGRPSPIHAQQLHMREAGLGVGWAPGGEQARE